MRVRWERPTSWKRNRITASQSDDDYPLISFSLLLFPLSPPRRGSKKLGKASRVRWRPVCLASCGNPERQSLTDQGKKIFDDEIRLFLFNFQFWAVQWCSKWLFAHCEMGLAWHRALVGNQSLWDLMHMVTCFPHIMNSPSLSASNLSKMNGTLGAKLFFIFSSSFFPVIQLPLSLFPNFCRLLIDFVSHDQVDMWDPDHVSEYHPPLR